MAKRQVYNNAEIVFTCSEAFHYKGEMIVEEHSLVRVLSGELKVIQADKTYIFGAGETHLFPRNQLATLIKYEKDGLPYQAIVMKLTTSYLQDFYTNHTIENVLRKSQKIVALTKSPLLASFFASLLPYFELENKLPSEISKLKITEAITILRTLNKDIDCILSDFSEPHKINISEFMERNYMFNMPIEKFAYLTGRSLTTFKRDFKKTFATTPQKWLTEKRLELARYQLVEKRRKPIDIFYEVGFENLSHFSYAFKKHFGLAPTELISQS
ncbi:AraC family transcriptional regulator [Chryseobacterium fluminis]|uniref:AraC family transcriptional regulator n=1 Tax=Chryseobacterium fluminis TaxID=2983606 RepID=UPI002252FD2D|nr:AraC family transcriptional regulator [Chryseobacterium sp. MMS21-Ot14]UZT98961.1 AraC family transcriptional regulator [Chryseobacterium sp. MMS21-Ot14]